MSRFTEVFPSGKAFLPVIHVENETQMHRNLEIALTNGADGAFLIGHSMNALALKAIYESARAEHSGAWIGLNYLDLRVNSALMLCDETVSGLWADDAEFEMDGLYPDCWLANTAALLEWRRREHLSSDRLLYFGGVHFKGQDQISDPAEMARIAYPFMDVVTTSGPGTGLAADPEKIEAMRKAIGNDGHLGLASGCTSENVADYKDYVDAFLVATGISRSFYELNPGKVASFAKNYC